MGFKELSEIQAKQLQISHNEIARLQRDVAELQERSNANRTDSVQPSDIKLREDLTALKAQLHDANTAKAEYAQQAFESEVTLEGTFAKLAKIEQESLNQAQNFRAQVNSLAGELEAQREEHTNQVSAIQEDNARLKSANASLTNQLQAEKQNNNRGGIGYRSDPRKGYDQDDDQDDEEALPVAYVPPTSFTNGVALPTRSKPVFRMPSATSDDFEKLLTMREAPQQPAKATKKSSQPASKKRKPSAQDEIAGELRDLDGEYITAPPATSRKKRKSAGTTTFRGKQESDDFDFKAVMRYREDGEMDYFSSEDLDECEYLLARIRKTEAIWTGLARYDKWQTEFKESGCDAKPVCVTKKLAGGRTKWRQGAQGVYACRDCVKMGRPCLTWVQAEEHDEWSMWEFRLLPLHDDDRTHPVEEKKTEVRYWVNDYTKFRDDDVVKDGGSDGDFVD